MRDAPLTNHGFAQATRLGKHFAKVPITGELPATRLLPAPHGPGANSELLVWPLAPRSDLLLRPQARPHDRVVYPPAQRVDPAPAADGLALAQGAELWRRRGVSLVGAAAGSRTGLRLTLSCTWYRLSWSEGRFEFSQIPWDSSRTWSFPDGESKDDVAFRARAVLRHFVYPHLLDPTPQQHISERLGPTDGESGRDHALPLWAS